MKVCLKQVWKARKLDNTNLRGSITAWLISCLCYSDSAALLMLNQKQFYLLGQIQTRQTEDQPYCDTSPYGECSLIPGLRFLVKIRCLLATDQIFVFYLGCVMRRSIWASWRLWRQVGCDVVSRVDDGIDSLTPSLSWRESDTWRETLPTTAGTNSIKVFLTEMIAP